MESQNDQIISLLKGILNANSQLDPNWFYSSLAQCSASLVGLIGGILAGRLNDQANLAKNSKIELEAKLKAFREIVRNDLQVAKSFEKFALSRLKVIDDSGNVITINNELEYFGGSASFGDTKKVLTKEYIEKLKSDFSKCQETVNFLEANKNITNTQESLEFVFKMLNKFTEKVPLHIIEKYGNRGSELAKSSDKHLAICNTRYFMFLTLVVIWISVVGLILPLCGLSSHGLVSKNIFLFAFGLGVLAIPIFISFELFRIGKLRVIKIDL